MSVIDRLLVECREASPHVGGACPWCGRSLPAGRRRWCSDTCRADFVDNHFWGHARERALARDRRTCRHCGARRRRLEVHHVDPRRGQGYAAGCHHHVDMLETLCHRCHVAATNAHAAAEARARLAQELREPAASVPERDGRAGNAPVGAAASVRSPD